MTDTWESLFKESAVKNDHTENYLKECFEYAGNLHQRNLPVIFDFVHLVLNYNLLHLYYYFLFQIIHTVFELFFYLLHLENFLLLYFALIFQKYLNLPLIVML